MRGNAATAVRSFKRKAPRGAGLQAVSTPLERVGGLGAGGERGIRNVGIFLSQKKSTTGWVTNSALANPIRVALQLITLAREKGQ